MNDKKKQFYIYASQFEKQLYTALNYFFVHDLTLSQCEMLASLYNEIDGVRKVYYSNNCNSCIMDAVMASATYYFALKKELEVLQEKTKCNEQQERATTAIKGSKRKGRGN